MTVPVTPHQSTTVYSYTLGDLYSGMNYTITVRAGNVLGESNEAVTRGETTATSIGFKLYTVVIIHSLICINSSHW